MLFMSFFLLSLWFTWIRRWINRKEIYFWWFWRRCWVVSRLMYFVMMVKKVHTLEIAPISLNFLGIVILCLLFMIQDINLLFWLYIWNFMIILNFFWNQHFRFLPWKSVRFEVNLILKCWEWLIHIIEIKPYNKRVKSNFKAKSIGSFERKILMNMCKC